MRMQQQQRVRGRSSENVEVTCLCDFFHRERTPSMNQGAAVVCSREECAESSTSAAASAAAAAWEDESGACSSGGVEKSSSTMQLPQPLLRGSGSHALLVLAGRLSRQPALNRLWSQSISASSHDTGFGLRSHSFWKVGSLPVRFALTMTLVILFTSCTSTERMARQTRRASVSERARVGLTAAQLSES